MIALASVVGTIAVVVGIVLAVRGGSSETTGATTTSTTTAVVATTGSTTTTAGGPGGVSTTVTSTESGATSSTTSAVTTTRPGPTTTTISRSALDAAYRDSYTKMCAFIWSRAPKKIMYDPDDGAGQEWTYDDCMSMLPTLAVSADARTVADARTEGHDDAVSKVEDFSVGGTLCWVDPVSEAFVGCWDPQTPDRFVGPPSG